MNKKELAAMIDHTLLKPEATKEDIKKLCSEAVKYNFASVCVNPCNVKLAKECLCDSNVSVCTVIGFPLGANSSDVKAYEAKKAVDEGAKEVDMVINIGRVKENDFNYVREDINKVVKAVEGKAIVKVIIETCLLNNEEKVLSCKAALEAGAHFVKTSTGFSKGGATYEDVKLMHDTVGGQLKVKASGGIRTTSDALKMIEAGADRIGASASISIVEGLK